MHRPKKGNLMNLATLFAYILIFLFGAVIGSFLNVCILRIPAGESIVTGPSHCPKCGKRLNWYEMFPIFSYLALRGRCSGCKAHISAQYPLIEAVNGVLWIIVFQRFGLSPEALIGALLTSAILTLSVIDERTQEIPEGINLFILVLAIVASALDYTNWLTHLIGAFAVSVPTALIFFITKGCGIGGGDVKLMSVCGLLLGWKLIILAFFVGCILGALIHIIRMKISNKGHVLALGPYLSVGVFFAMLWGERLINWYLGFII